MKPAKKCYKQNAQQGFSLIEVLVVMAITVNGEALEGAPRAPGDAEALQLVDLGFQLEVN